MKNSNYILAFMLFAGSLFTVQAQNEQTIKENQDISTDKVEVYYFHNTRRCATCNAVEEVTKTALDEYYPEQMKSGTILSLTDLRTSYHGLIKLSGVATERMIL